MLTSVEVGLRDDIDVCAIVSGVVGIFSKKDIVLDSLVVTSTLRSVIYLYLIISARLDL